MENIVVCKTEDLSESDWIKYAESFNGAFGKEFQADFFRRKYASAGGGSSFHALLKPDAGAIAGACTAMPMSILDGTRKINAALLVDVFIAQKYRTNPMTLMKMYRRLAGKLKECGCAIVLAVPNAMAYPYWKNIVKMADIGDINYWVIPVRLGNILKRFKFLNPFSAILSSAALFLSKTFFAPRGYKHTRSYRFSIETNKEYLERRFPPDIYARASSDGCEYCYRICDENGVSAAYIMYFTENSRRTGRALCAALRDIMAKNPDIIIHVGKMPFRQCAMIRLPRKFEPKRLPLVFDRLSESELPENISNMAEWDFGLSNYDVR